MYSVDHANAAKREEAQRLVTAALHDASGIISFQVIQETIGVITRKFAVPVRADDVLELLRTTLLPLWRVHPSERLYTEAVALHRAARLSFYDALIVAAALEAGCDTLYTEDLNHGQRFGELSVVNPFL